VHFLLNNSLVSTSTIVIKKYLFKGFSLNCCKLISIGVDCAATNSRIAWFSTVTSASLCRSLLRNFLHRWMNRLLMNKAKSSELCYPYTKLFVWCKLIRNLTFQELYFLMRKTKTFNMNTCIRYFLVIYGLLIKNTWLFFWEFSVSICMYTFEIFDHLVKNELCHKLQF